MYNNRASGTRTQHRGLNVAGRGTLRGSSQLRSWLYLFTGIGMQEDVPSTFNRRISA